MFFDKDSGEGRSGEVGVVKLGKVGVSLNHRTFSAKPDKGMIGAITREIASQRIDISLIDLAHLLVAPNGRSWSPAVFGEITDKDGKSKFTRCNDCWFEQQLFAIDIDSGIDFNEAIRRCEEYKVYPVFAYNTFSDTCLNKFRLVFCFVEKVKERRLRDFIFSSLKNLFPEMDASTSDPSRLFFGGKEIIYEQYEARIDFHSLYHAVDRFFVISDKSNYQRKREKYHGDNGLIQGDSAVISYPPFEVLVNNEKEIASHDLTKSEHSLYIYNREGADFVKKSFAILFADEPEKKRKRVATQKDTSNNTYFEKIRNIDTDTLKEKCQLFGDFDSGVKLRHEEYLLLGSNLKQIENGITIFHSCMSSQHFYNTDVTNKMLRGLKDGVTVKCNTFCHYQDSCFHERNILSTIKQKRGMIRIVEPQEEITLEEAERKLDSFMDSVMASDSDNIYIIKAPTGIGKTERYLRYEGVTIATPTHALAEEVASRFREKGKTCILSPNVRDFNPYDFERYFAYHSMGAHISANRELARLARNNNREALDYLRICSELKKTETTKITTHDKVISSGEFENIIFDEDPLLSFFKLNIIRYYSLKIFCDYLKCREHFDSRLFSIRKVIEEVLNSTQNNIIENPLNEICNAEEFEQTDIFNLWQEKELCGIPVISFLRSDFWRVDKEISTIQFIEKRELPACKIIILSATVNETIYKRLYGDRVQFLDVGHVTTRGKIVQYTSRSFSRNCIRESPELIEFVKAKIGRSYVVTHSIFRDSFENAIGHFGAIRGLNGFAGKDIAVVGTPHVNSALYMLIAKELDKDFDHNEKMKMTVWKYNGMEFYFNTFSNKYLRNIHLNLIEGELVQAIGRARILRNDCRVMVFSNFPIQGAHYISENIP